MACRFPGADDLEAYWSLLERGQVAIQELPESVLSAEYFDANPAVAGRSSSRFGGLIPSRRFSPEGSSLPVEIVKPSDECHLLMAEIAVRACEDASLDTTALSRHPVGVFVGHDRGSSRWNDVALMAQIEDIAEVLADVDSLSDQPEEAKQRLVHEWRSLVLASLHSSTGEPRRHDADGVASVVARALQLQGPTCAIDSACASSLQAVHIGVRALQSGRVKAAIVGGAASWRLDTIVEFSRAGAVSSTGARPFDAEADGVVCSEGYAAIVLKRLDEALRDGDSIRAVIRGAGVSSDGRAKGMWAPSSDGQILAIRRAYGGGVEFSDTQYIEAHATSTPLGDATELNSLQRVLSEQCPEGPEIPISSTKGNLGHTLEAAGLAGLIKTVLAFEHERIPPAVNVRWLNRKFDWEASRLAVRNFGADWIATPPGRTRQAGIDAFGLGGLNAHVVVDDSHKSLENDASGESREEDPGGTQGETNGVALGALGSVANTMMSKPEIAIIGAGCFLPGARNFEALRAALASGSNDAEILNGGRVSDFEYDWRRHKIPPRQIEQMDPLHLLFLEAVDQAMDSAETASTGLSRERTGVMVGTRFGGDFVAQVEVGLRLPELQVALETSLEKTVPEFGNHAGLISEFGAKLLNQFPELLDETGSFHNSSRVSRIMKTWDLMGGGASVDSGAGSADEALAVCVEMLRSGDADTMVWVAGDRQRISGLRDAHHLSQDRNQQTPEWAGALILSRLDDATRTGQQVLGILPEGPPGRRSDDSLLDAVVRILSLAAD